jgi:hypothetical protein
MVTRRFAALYVDTARNKNDGHRSVLTRQRRQWHFHALIDRHH